MARCIYCGQSDFYDGGLDGNGDFICIDCIAENPEANRALEIMQPAESQFGPMVYPKECYDVNRYKKGR